MKTWGKELERKPATEYPTRYCAFDNPRVLWEQSKAIEKFETTGQMEYGGYEYAVFHAPIVNAMYPHLTDGTYAAIVSYQGKSFLAEYHFTAPSVSRKQINRGERVSTYTEALALVRSWLGAK